jgi:putative phosphoesterase
MRIALIGDVHANLPALEAVLEHCLQKQVRAIWNSGDLVGYNAFPEEVIWVLRKSGVVSVIGNYDAKVLKFPSRDRKWRKKKIRPKWFSFKWTYDHLSGESRSYLGLLPAELRLTVNGNRVLLTHGSPASIREPLGPDSSNERLSHLVKLGRADVIVSGHSHHPFSRKVGNTWFVNTGSVGRPDDGFPLASYAVLEMDESAVRVEHFRVEYDLDRAAEGVRVRGLPEEFGAMIRAGRPLDWVLAQNEVG